MSTISRTNVQVHLRTLHSPHNEDVKPCMIALFCKRRTPITRKVYFARLFTIILRVHLYTKPKLLFFFKVIHRIRGGFAHSKNMSNIFISQCFTKETITDTTCEKRPARAFFVFLSTCYNCAKLFPPFALQSRKTHLLNGVFTLLNGQLVKISTNCAKKHLRYFAILF